MIAINPGVATNIQQSTANADATVALCVLVVFTGLLGIYALLYFAFRAWKKRRDTSDMEMPGYNEAWVDVGRLLGKDK